LPRGDDSRRKEEELTLTTITPNAPLATSTTATSMAIPPGAGWSALVAANPSLVSWERLAAAAGAWSYHAP
jgi:hypothetical protein